MAEAAGTIQNINELQAYREALRQVRTTKQELVDALGAMVGQLVDIEGYPFDAVSTGNPDPATGRRRYVACPAGRTFPDGDAEVEPVTYRGRQLLRADDRELEVSVDSTNPYQPDAVLMPGRVVAFSFRLQDIISVSSSEQQPI